MTSLSPGLVVRLVRIDAREPSVWLAAAASVVAVVAHAAAWRPWLAAGSGGLLAVAALGSLILALPGLELGMPRLTARLLWPIAGGVAGAILAMAFGPGAAAGLRALAVVAAGSVAAGVAGVLAARWQLAAAWRGGSMGSKADELGTGIVPLVGRSRLDAAAMASTLAAMAVCYFLVPEWAGGYALVASAWFTLLAVPAAVVAGGDAAARRGLVAAAAGSSRLPGAPARGRAVLLSYAAVLGWPAAVAAMLWRRPPVVHGPLGAIAALLGLVTVAAAAASVAGRQHWADDLPLAVVAATLAVAVALSPWFA